MVNIMNKSSNNKLQFIFKKVHEKPPVPINLPVNFGLILVEGGNQLQGN